METILKRFEKPDEVREFEKGRFELVSIGGLLIGRATYEPGWKWSTHVGPAVGADRCSLEHGGGNMPGEWPAGIIASEGNESADYRITGITQNDVVWLASVRGMLSQSVDCFH